MKERKEKQNDRVLNANSGEVLGVDLATTGVKVVRMRSSRDGLSLTGCLELPVILLNGARPEGSVVGLQLPKEYRGRNIALALTSKKSVVRLLNLPNMARQSRQADSMIRGHAGLDESYRLGYTVFSPQRGKKDTSVLAVGLPDGEARSVLDLIDDNVLGTLSLEVSALAAASAFAYSPAAREEGGAVGLIEAGATVTCLTIFSKGQPVLLRKFDFGSLDTLRRVQRQFGVDDKTAQSIIADSSFDISQAVQESVGPFLRQLAISREFVERKAGVPIKAWYLSGGITLAAYWGERIRAAVGGSVKVWNPMEGIQVHAGVWPAQLKGQECRFAAAIGAAVGALHDS